MKAKLTTEAIKACTEAIKTTNKWDISVKGLDIMTKEEKLKKLKSFMDKIKATDEYKKDSFPITEGRDFIKAIATKRSHCDLLFSVASRIDGSLRFDIDANHEVAHVKIYYL